MHISKQSSVNTSVKNQVCECKNPRCRAVYEVTAPYQSKMFCPDCLTPPKTCVHGLRTTERCEACKKKSGSYFIRQM